MTIFKSHPKVEISLETRDSMSKPFIFKRRFYRFATKAYNDINLHYHVFFIVCSCCSFCDNNEDVVSMWHAQKWHFDQPLSQLNFSTPSDLICVFCGAKWWINYNQISRQRYYFQMNINMTGTFNWMKSRKSISIACPIEFPLFIALETLLHNLMLLTVVSCSFLPLLLLVLSSFQ